ncbi:MAG TPA: HEAT repeat domain-containing protein [Gemmatimonadaceae bacterium]
MDDLSPFATHFARLVWLLAQQPDDQEEHKNQLRQALSQLSSEPQSIMLHDVSMSVANAVSQEEEPEWLVWFGELSVRMSSHSVRALEFDVAAPAREVMAVAQALASLPVPGDGGEAFDEKLVALSLTGVTAQLGQMGFVRRAITEMPASAGPTKTPALPMRAYSSTPAGVFRLSRTTPVALRANPAASTESQHMMQQQLMPLSKPQEGVSKLAERLDEALHAGNTTAAVDDVARAAEDLARQGAWNELVDVLDRLYEHYDRQHDGDIKRAFLMGIRRLQRPALLHGIARLLPSRRDLRDTIGRLLARAGEAGADALIDNLISSDLAAERRAFRDALGLCPAGVGALLHLLTDERWYVVRNAVELLGELAPPNVDARVAQQLSHREPRVRRAAAIALGRLGTQRSVLGLLQAMNDPSPDVRLQAAHGLGAVRNPRAVPWLVEALDAEADPDVQSALLAALGRTPTEDAVARLIRAAEPGGVLLRKPLPARLRAVESLGVAGTPAARDALRELLQDRDSEVREAAQQVVSRLGVKD